jgi:hypothetical protein
MVARQLPEDLVDGGIGLRSRGIQRQYGLPAFRRMDRDESLAHRTRRGQPHGQPPSFDDRLLRRSGTVIGCGRTFLRPRWRCDAFDNGLADGTDQVARADGMPVRARGRGRRQRGRRRSRAWRPDVNAGEVPMAGLSVNRALAKQLGERPLGPTVGTKTDHPGITATRSFRRDDPPKWKAGRRRHGESAASVRGRRGPEFPRARRLRSRRT